MSHQGWTVTRLPSGETRLELNPGRRQVRLAMELGFTGLAAGLGAVVACFIEAVEARLTGLAIVAASVGFAIRSLRSPSPKAWVLAPGRATVEWKRGKQETFTPSNVIIESIRDRPGVFNRTYSSVYDVWLETPQGRIVVHGGTPSGDQHDLARTVAEALGVEVVQLWREPSSD